MGRESVTSSVPRSRSPAMARAGKTTATMPSSRSVKGCVKASAMLPVRLMTVAAPEVGELPHDRAGLHEGSHLLAEGLEHDGHEGADEDQAQRR